MSGADFAGEYWGRLDGPWHDIQGHMPFLRDAALGGKTVIELGVRTGNSTSAFLYAMAVCDGGRLWSADVNVPQVPAAWFHYKRWLFIRGSDTSPEVLEWMPQECDVLFIDTSHTYEHTLAELRAYMPRVKPGGKALLHDTQFAPPGTDLGEPVGEVARALDDYCGEAGLSWENRPGYYGLGVISL